MAFMFARDGFDNLVKLIISFFPYLLPQFFIMYFMGIFTLSAFAGFLHQIKLGLALYLNGFMSKFEGLQAFLLPKLRSFHLPP